MRITNNEERQAAAQTLRAVMEKFEEAWRLARELEQTGEHQTKESLEVTGLDG